MKAIQFKNAASQKIYDNYIRRIKRVTKILAEEDREEILLEFNSHIFEANQQVNTGSEINTLLDVLNKLGDPEEVLLPLIADKKLRQATKSLNPFDIVKGLALNIRNGVAYLLFSLMYLSLLGFGYAIIMKLIYPKEVGLFLDNGSFETLGTYKGISPDDGVVEVLGHWFIPTMLLCAIVLFILITLTLRIHQKLKR